MRDDSSAAKARKWRRSVDHHLTSMPNSLLGSRYSSMVSLESLTIHRSTSMLSVRGRAEDAQSVQHDIFRDDFAEIRNDDEDTEDDGVSSRTFCLTQLSPIDSQLTVPTIGNREIRRRTQ